MREAKATILGFRLLCYEKQREELLAFGLAMERAAESLLLTEKIP